MVSSVLLARGRAPKETGMMPWSWWTGGNERELKETLTRKKNVKKEPRGRKRPTVEGGRTGLIL